MVINGKSQISYDAMIKSKSLNAFFDDEPAQESEAAKE